jgi:hypothetical protein
LRFVRLCLLALTLGAVEVTTPHSVSGQATLAPGDRIRVKPATRPTDRLTGTFLAAPDDTLSFRAQDEVHRIALSDIKTLQVSTGEKTHTAGTLVGGVTGALGGMALGSAIEKALDTDCTEWCGLTGGAVGFVLGAAIGASAGYLLLGEEKWRDVPPETLRVGLGSVAVELRVGF